jgi:hypothetical protein
VTKRRGDGDWVRGIAIAIVTAFIVDGFLKAAQKPAKRAPGRIVPSVVPPGLPAFPSTSWTPYTGAPLAVAQRAAQLLFSLWRTGEGATVTEETAGEWITYQAQTHVEAGKRKKGVGAWHLKAGVHGALG